MEEREQINAQAQAKKNEVSGEPQDFTSHEAAPKRNIGKIVGLTILGLIVGMIVFFGVSWLLSIIIQLLGRNPFLRYILYFPADASWALIVLPGSTAVMAAGTVCSKICGSVKPVAITIVILYAISLVVLIAARATTIPLVISSVIIIVSALLALVSKSS